jgi:hypothetical protein
MKYLPLFFALAACHPLADVADKVPVTISCPPPNPDAARELIARFASDPDLVEKELRGRVVEDPLQALAVTCELLDVKAVLLESGQRMSEAYTKTTEALAALGVE